MTPVTIKRQQASMTHPNATLFLARRLLNDPNFPAKKDRDVTHSET